MKNEVFNVTKMRFWGLFFLMLLISLGSALAIDYDNEVVEQDLTSFSWCFDNPFGTDYALMKENFIVYQDNFGTDLIDATLFVRAEAKQSVEVCKYKEVCSEVEYSYISNVTGKEVKHKVEECGDVEECKYEDVNVIDWFDVEETNILMKTADRFCYKANRKAQTGFKPIDMNFLYNDGDYNIDVKADGKLWWNTTWEKKYSVNVTGIADNPYHPYEVILNNSVITMSDCSEDNIRLLDSTETTPQIFNIANFTATESYIYINNSINVSEELWLYCNATGVSSVSVSLESLNLTTGASHYILDEASGTIYDSNGLFNGSLTGATYGATGIIGDALDFDGGGDYVNLGATAFDFKPSEPFSINLWASPDITMSGDKYFISHQDGAGGDAYRGWGLWWRTGTNTIYLETLGSGGSHTTTWSYTFITDNWYNLNLRFDGLDTAVLKINNTEIAIVSASGTWGGTTTTRNTYIGGRDSIPAQSFGGRLDEVLVVNRMFSDNETSYLFFNGLPQTHTFFARPNVVFGAVEGQAELTDISLGLFDEDYNNISLTVDEGEDFFVWANYSYDVNGTAVYPEGWCNYSATNILSEDYNMGVGTNLTVCGVGCDSTNYTISFSGLHTSGFNNDILRFKLCRDTTAVNEMFSVSTNYSGVYEFSYTTIPTCDAGYVDVSVIDSNSSGAESVEVSVWSSAGANKDLMLFDSFVGIDRDHNASENMTFNVSSQLFIGKLHEYYEHGSETIYVDCQDGEGIENQTGNSLSIVVENIPPVLVTSTIWDWFTGFVEINGVSPVMKYPLQSTINVTGLAVDDDLEACIFGLYYYNHTNIDSLILPAFGGVLGGSVNYTQSDFSTETLFLDGTNGYIWNVSCNDTSGNTSFDTFSFTAQNNRPTATFNDSSLSITDNTTIGWVCYDSEEESMTSHLFLDGNLIYFGALDYYDYEINDTGTHNFNVSCEDGFSNSINDTLAVTVSSATSGNMSCVYNNEPYIKEGISDITDRNKIDWVCTFPNKSISYDCYTYVTYAGELIQSNPSETVIDSIGVIDTFKSHNGIVRVWFLEDDLRNGKEVTFKVECAGNDSEIEYFSALITPRYKELYEVFDRTIHTKDNINYLILAMFLLFVIGILIAIIKYNINYKR